MVLYITQSWCLIPSEARYLIMRCKICDCIMEDAEIRLDVDGKILPCTQCWTEVLKAYYDVVDLEQLDEDDILKDTELYLDD